MYSTATALDRIVQHGVNWFERRGMSFELEQAVDEVVQAVEYAQSYSELYDTLVTIWDYHYDILSDEERQKFDFYLMTPLVALL